MFTCCNRNSNCCGEKSIIPQDALRTFCVFQRIQPIRVELPGNGGTVIKVLILLAIDVPVSITNMVKCISINYYEGLRISLLRTHEGK